MVWEGSVLDANEGIRFHGREYSNPSLGVSFSTLYRHYQGLPK